jgi:hypothetical protein
MHDESLYYDLTPHLKGVHDEKGVIEVHEKLHPQRVRVVQRVIEAQAHGADADQN